MSTRNRAARTPGAANLPAASADSVDQAAPSAESTGVVTEMPAAPAPAGLADLPNAIDIDPKKIRGPVLTKQGWVCPDESDRPARDAMKL